MAVLTRYATCLVVSVLLSLTLMYSVMAPSSTTSATNSKGDFAPLKPDHLMNAAEKKEFQRKQQAQQNRNAVDARRRAVAGHTQKQRKENEQIMSRKQQQQGVVAPAVVAPSSPVVAASPSSPSTADPQQPQLRHDLVHRENIPESDENNNNSNDCAESSLIDGPRKQLQVRQLCEPYSPRTPLRVAASLKCRAVAADLIAVDLAQVFKPNSSSANSATNGRVNQCREINDASFREISLTSVCAQKAVRKVELHELSLQQNQQNQQKKQQASDSQSSPIRRVVVSLVFSDYAGSNSIPSRDVPYPILDSCRTMLHSFLSVASEGDVFVLAVALGVEVFQRLAADLMNAHINKSSAKIQIVSTTDWKIPELQKSFLASLPSIHLRPLFLHHLLSLSEPDLLGLASAQQILFVDSRDTIFQANPFDAFASSLPSSSFMRNRGADFLAAVADPTRVYDDIRLRQRVQQEILKLKEERFFVASESATHGARRLPDGFSIPVVDSNILLGTLPAMRRFTAMWKEFLLCANIAIHGGDVLDAAAFHVAVYFGVNSLSKMFSLKGAADASFLILDPWVGPFRGRIQLADDVPISTVGNSLAVLNCQGEKFAILRSFAKSHIAVFQRVYNSVAEPARKAAAMRVTAAATALLPTSSTKSSST